MKQKIAHLDSFRMMAKSSIDIAQKNATVLSLKSSSSVTETLTPNPPTTTITPTDMPQHQPNHPTTDAESTSNVHHVPMSRDISPRQNIPR